jgi:fibro-slime domain-containing protein
MRKNIGLPFAIFLVFIGLGLRPALAQAPTDSLNGKTIHLYVESGDFNAFYFQNGDIPLKVDSKYNYSITLTGQDLYKQDFFFSSNGTRPDGEHYAWKLSKIGLAAAEGARFTVPDFAGHKEMWIVVDPAGPVTAPPVILFEAPKVINMLNPWITTAPKLVYGTNKSRAMSTTPGQCGWFTTLILDATLTKGHFSEVNNTESYGKGGLTSTEDFDFAALFAANGPSIWLNTQANSWTAAYPQVPGQCSYDMAVTVRDFSKDHPDFDPGVTGDHSVKGVVQNTIGPDPDRKPIVNPAGISKDPAISFKNFEKWWVTDSTNATTTLRSYQSCYDIPMSKSSDGAWEYDSYRDGKDHGFWPVDGTLNKFNELPEKSCYAAPDGNWPNTPPHNGNFCMESHASFIYQKGQKFAFRGDDDVWVFINNKLVVDLGGIHVPKSDSVNLDTLRLTADSTYKWDLFYCDRQGCGSSLRIKTSIYFKQQKSLYGIDIPGPTPGSISKEIWKRAGGTGSCASVGSTIDSAKATNLSYQILDATGKLVEDLENGKTFHGGISINTPLITVDTSKLTTTTLLVPGQTYRVVAFEPANASLKVEVPFKVPVRNYVDFDSPATATAMAGQLIMVIASNRDQAGAKAAGALSYSPIVQSGLLVYSDAAGKTPAEATLTTNADGLDTIWVTANPTVDQSYTLQLAAPAKLAPKLTFTVPTDAVNFVPPLAHDTLIGSIVTIDLQAVDKTGPQAKALPWELVIPAGLKVTSDAAGATPIASGSTGADGKFRIYATATDSTDPVDKTYILKLKSGGQEMKLTFRMPPVDLPKLVSAGIYDDNADGIGDRIEAAFDRDISAAKPKQVGYKWPSSAAAVVGADPTVAGKILTLKGAFSAAILTAGSGTFTATYQVRKSDSIQSVNLDDHIGPIIKSAEIFLGKTEDTLRIRLSEPKSGTGPGGTPADWFGIKRSNDAAVEYVPPVSPPEWTDDRSMVTLIYSNLSPNVPRAGNLVRIEDRKDLITDERGNTSGPASRFRVITGGKRSEIKTVTLHDLQSDGVIATAIVPSLQATNATVEQVVESTKRMGFLLKTDLASFAVGDDFNPISPSQVALEWDVKYFTNHGEFVNEAKGTAACNDQVLFQGDCSAHRGFLFIGWNGTTKNGDKVGTGAYVARMRYAVKVAGQAKETGGLDQIWGVKRKP